MELGEAAVAAAGVDVADQVLKAGQKSKADEEPKNNSFIYRKHVYLKK